MVKKAVREERTTWRRSSSVGLSAQCTSSNMRSIGRAAGCRQLCTQFGLRAVPDIPRERLHERLVRHEVFLIAVPDEDGAPFGNATAGELERQPRLSNPWLTPDEQQLMMTAFRTLPHILHLQELGFASDEINRGGGKQRRRQGDAPHASWAIHFIVGCLSNVCDEPIPALRH